MNSFEFSIGGEESARRAFRAQVPGLEVWVAEHDAAYSVKDVSATGLAVQTQGKPFKEGQSVHLDMMISKRLFISQLPCKVVRVLASGVVAFDFLELDRRQEARLDKLVLEVQKRSIAKKRTGLEED
ncbi:PilZ domain-containing protein [Desulfovibrio psychrotolerans]|uniref:Pilus assembly protein PilZ n=1 Tax=Desulfovibrio psychrotolerans TaxID=415242 RepID=A0A7J0BV29_9BACT|nr:PilZ domain-containing protein [Desulfovibrio psychrotolerans]GFM37566.1 pilus assembly protein PilZ [Desulfovibrio psychrotolerans]